ncbi:ferric reductase [Paxillus involutus ATCC 200175]|uniref:ferric-chelate reductase (NADPH) n=1 Tax=Paxillus involutus ATCC 200175 TaxID=664439 RepID=A0A0C9SUI9_PAXIN|nr:ferric reductase [Paxillus involutus ATCC 200175]
MLDDAVPPYPSPPSINALALVFHVDIFLLAIVAVFALATLPRAIARFSRAAEWRHGHILRSTRLETRRPRAPLQPTSPHNAQGPSPSNPSPPDPGFASSSGHDGPQDGATSEASHTYFSHSHLLRHGSARSTRSGSLPPHVRAWSAILPPFGGFLRYRLDSGFSVGQAIVLGIYSVLLIYATFYASNPFGQPLRSGTVAMSQIPVVYMLGTKNNVLGMIVAMGYEKLNYIHRYAGQMLVLLANVHAIGYFYEWTFQGTFSKNMSEPARMWALIALLAVDVLWFFSTSFWRRKAYNIFFGTHIICFTLFLPAAYLHQKLMLPYIIAASAAYGLDHVLRLLKTRLFAAHIRPIHDLSLTRIEIPELNAGWRAGQHVRIRVLSSAMGWIGWAEVHPFTIASVAKTPEGLVLMCKTAGRWTGRLYEMAKVAGYGCEEGGVGRSVSIMVEGPYGGTGHAVFASFSAAMFIVGGSGITFALAAVQDLIQRDLEGSSRVKIIELIWCIQDPCALNPLVPLFTSLIQQSTRAPLKISVHYTRAADIPPSKEFLPGLTLTAGRPRIAKVLDAVIARAVSYGSGIKASMDITGVVVGACGPVGLGDEVSQAVSAVDPGRRWAVGGIEMYEETFGW